MSKCADSLDHWTTRQVARRVVETVVAGLVILMMAACNVGPNYKRPATTTPQSFRGALAPEIAAPAQAEPSIGDQKWSTIFQDPVLQRLVAEALENNLDLRVAAQRVLEAQAQAGITRTQQLPSINAGSQLLRAASTIRAGGQQI